MKPEVKKALEESIAHWWRMATGKAKEGEGPAGGDCALCNLFPHWCRGPLGKCLIYKETHVSNCDATPYWNAALIWDDQGPNSPEFRKAARKMHKFLCGLRE